MASSSAGYGIAAHMNTYSTGVKCGNWVEDRFGDELSKMDRPMQAPIVSEARSTLLRPTDMDDRAGKDTPESTKTELVMGRPGVPYSLIFGHGIEEGKAQDRFATMNSMLMSGKPDMKSDTLLKTKKKTAVEAQLTAAPGQSSTKLREKLKAEARAKRDGQFNTTNGKNLNKRMVPVERKARTKTDIYMS